MGKKTEDQKEFEEFFMLEMPTRYCHVNWNERNKRNNYIYEKTSIAYTAWKAAMKSASDKYKG